MNNKKPDKATYMYIHKYEDISKAYKKIASYKIKMEMYLIKENLKKSILTIIKDVDPDQKEKFETVSGNYLLSHTLKLLSNIEEFNETN